MAEPDIAVRIEAKILVRDAPALLTAALAAFDNSPWSKSLDARGLRQRYGSDPAAAIQFMLTQQDPIIPDLPGVVTAACSVTTEKRRND
jgi:hypothetical protein